MTRENDCPHPSVTVHLHRFPATREQPEEVVGKAYCDECGKVFDLEDIPEGAKQAESWE